MSAPSVAGRCGTLYFHVNILIVTLGSHGDVHPFVGIGAELRRRGHNVAIATNAHFGPLIESAGVGFEPLGRAEWFAEGIKNPDMWHRYRGFKTIFAWGVIPMIRPTYELIVGRRPRPDVVIASSLALGARVAQDKLGIPVVTVHLSPSIFRSTIKPPVMPGLFMPNWMPQGIKRRLWEGGDKYVIDPVIAPGLNQVRRDLGLKPVENVLRHWWNSPLRVIGMFPAWYAPPQADWPEQTRLTGFGLYDEADVTPLDPALRDWLAAGAAPIAFTPGSAMIHGQRFFRTAVAACQKLSRRGILLTRHTDQVPRDLPPGVRHEAFAPFSELLPHVAAVVHHGGIGTTAQALVARKPQLIMPMGFDQPDNAARLQRLGVGETLRPTFFRTPLVVRKLRRLLTDPAVQRACGAIPRIAPPTAPAPATTTQTDAQSRCNFSGVTDDAQINGDADDAEDASDANVAATADGALAKSPSGFPDGIRLTCDEIERCLPTAPGV